MTQQKKPPQVNIPEIEKCPRCGHHILLGDKKCSNCGYDVSSPLDFFRNNSATYIAFLGLFLGGLLALAATGMEDLQQLIFLAAGFGLMVGGGVYMALSLLFNDDRRRR